MKALFLVLGLGFSIGSALVYWHAIYRRTVKPHLFSWLIWGTTMGIAGTAQWASGGGLGAWVTLNGSLNCLLIALASIRIGHKAITVSDWFCLTFAFAAIPLWVVTHQPLWSVLLATLIDTSGYIPTFRKSWSEPRLESASTFILGSIATAASLLALKSYALVNWLYPAAIILVNATLVLTLWGRRMLRLQPSPTAPAHGPPLPPPTPRPY